jgi:hypothetical protein
MSEKKSFHTLSTTLTNTNFHVWCRLLKIHLEASDQWTNVICNEADGVLEDGQFDLFADGIEDPVQRREMRLKNARALATIVNSTSPDIQLELLELTHACEAYSHLQRRFEANKTVSRLRLMGQLYSKKMLVGEDVDNHLAHFTSIVQQLTQMGKGIDDELVGLTLLHSLPTGPGGYDVFIELTEASLPDDATLDLTYVASRLRNEALNRKNRGNAYETQIAAAAQRVERPSGKKTFPKCGTCGMNNHAEKDCYEKNGYPVGHKKHGKHNGNKKKDRKANGKSNEIIVPMVMLPLTQIEPAPAPSVTVPPPVTGPVAATSTSGVIDPTVWLLDSGCSKNHATGHQHLFDADSLKPLDRQIKYLAGNGELIIATHSGTIRMKLETQTLVLSNVLFADKLRFNLLSPDRLLDDGHVNRVILLKKKGLIKGKFGTITMGRASGLWVLQPQHDIGIAAPAVAPDRPGYYEALIDREHVDALHVPDVR